MENTTSNCPFLWPALLEAFHATAVVNETQAGEEQKHQEVAETQIDDESGVKNVGSPKAPDPCWQELRVC